VTQAPADVIPEGFKPLFRSSPLLELIGPLYSKGTGVNLVLGMRAEQKHCNSRGIIHGGILSSLADTTMGYAVAFATDAPKGLVTANLTVDFAGAANPGDWMQASVDIQKQGSRLAFANCFVTVGDQRIVRASGVFLVTDPPQTT